MFVSFPSATSEKKTIVHAVVGCCCALPINHRAKKNSNRRTYRTPPTYRTTDASLHARPPDKRLALSGSYHTHYLLNAVRGTATYSEAKKGASSSARARRDTHRHRSKLSTALPAILSMSAEGLPANRELRTTRSRERSRPLPSGRKLHPSRLQFVLQMTHAPPQPRPFKPHLGNGWAVQSTPAVSCVHGIVWSEDDVTRVDVYHRCGDRGGNYGRGVRAI